MLRALICDLDGTLADTLPDLAAAVDGELARRGHPVHGLLPYRLMVGDGFTELVRRAAPARLGAAALEELRAAAVAAYGAAALERTRPYPGVPELLAALGARGIGLAVLTNKPDRLAKLIVAELFPAADFLLVRGETEEFPRKPDPAAALDLARRFGLPPAEVALLGDADIDMRTALAAGMLPLGAAWGYRGKAELRKAGAALVLSRPAEVAALFPGEPPFPPAGSAR